MLLVFCATESFVLHRSRKQLDVILQLLVSGSLVAATVIGTANHVIAVSHC